MQAWICSGKLSMVSNFFVIEHCGNFSVVSILNMNILESLIIESITNKEVTGFISTLVGKEEKIYSLFVNWRINL